MSDNKHEAWLRTELVKASTDRAKAYEDWAKAHARWVKAVVALANADADPDKARPALAKLDHAEEKP